MLAPRNTWFSIIGDSFSSVSSLCAGTLMNFMSGLPYSSSFIVVLSGS